MQATTKSFEETMAEAKELLSISDFYAEKTIFITGATGFLGKIVIEKLLRSCPLVKKIYVLTRSRRGVNPQQRIDNLLDSGVSFIVCALATLNVLENIIYMFIKLWFSLKNIIGKSHTCLLRFGFH